MANFLANILQNVAKALGAVESIDAVAETELAAVALGFSSYEAGAPVVLGQLSVEGKSGKIVAVMNGGSASIALGLG
jgi:hypothetical protein